MLRKTTFIVLLLASSLLGQSPTIVSLTPDRNALNVPTDAVITVVFDQNMDGGTINSSTFVVHGGFSGKLGGTYGTSGSLVTFTPTYLFKPGEQITVTLTNSIHNTSGLALVEADVWSFTAAVQGGYGTFAAPVNYGVGHNAVSVTAADLNGDGNIQGPVITNIVTSTSPQVGDYISVTATVTDPDGLQAVDLHYAQGGAASYSQAFMTGQGGDSYSGIIPGSAVTVAGVAYFIAAEDSYGNRDSSDVASVQVTFPSGTFTTAISGSAFLSGFPRNRWRLISIPGDIDNTSVSSIIQPSLGIGPSDTTWKIFTYVGPGPDDYALASSFASGESYFLKQNVADAVHFTLGAGQSVDLTGWSITLSPRRWRFISSPYPFPVAVDADQGIFKGPYTYGAFGSGGQEGWSMGQVHTTFKPWGGYIVYNNTGQVQILQIKPPGLSGGQMGMAKAILAKGDSEPVAGWLLALSVEGAHYFDVGNVIGRLQGAVEGLDDYDHPEPPYLDAYVSLVMEHPEWGTELPLFTYDVRSLEEVNGVWDLDLRTKGETGPIAITCAIQGEVPPDMQVVLLDLFRRQVYDLTVGEQPDALMDYSESLPYYLKVIAGTPDYVQGAVEEILAYLPVEFVLPVEFALSQNYPNPFNPSTTLRFDLPEATEVSLVVYDLLGREVARLVDRDMTADYHQVMWNGRDSVGREVPTGIYIARLLMPGYAKSIKMVLLK